MEDRLVIVIKELAALLNARDGNVPHTRLCELRESAQGILDQVADVVGKIDLPRY
jgi:hypothetical protein